MDIRDIYILFQIIGIAIMMVELLYIIFQKPSNLQKDLVIIMLTLIFAFIMYIVELDAESLEVAKLGCELGYIGKPFAMLTTMFLLLDYAHIKIKNWITLSIILYFVALTLIVFTNDYHHLYYTYMTLNLDRLGSPLEIGHGPFWYVYMASSFLLFGAYIAVVIYEFKYAQTKQAKEMTFFLFMMMFFSVLGLALFIAGLTRGYDTTLSGTLLGSLSLLILLVKYHLFDSLNLGKDYTLNNSNDGIIVLDAKENISYYNNQAIEFVPLLAKWMTHAKEKIVLEKLYTYKIGEPIFMNNKVYVLVKNEIKAKHSDLIIGKTFIFDEITEQYNYQVRLKIDVNNATERIKSIQRSVLIAFANLIEARDGYTGMHIKNVGYYAKTIALKLSENPLFKDELTKEKINIIEECSALHDVGKIKIPDRILGKPGKLTPEEFEIMKTHTTSGEQVIINTIQGVEEPDYVEVAKDIALYHHERWDGTGYPKQLKGEEIPLSARIVAVADVYDALRMKRPYKEQFSKEIAINIIKEESGTHFDSRVVDAFLEISDKL